MSDIKQNVNEKWSHDCIYAVQVKWLAVQPYDIVSIRVYLSYICTNIQTRITQQSDQSLGILMTLSLCLEKTAKICCKVGRCTIAKYIHDLPSKINRQYWYFPFAPHGVLFPTNVNGNYFLCERHCLDSATGLRNSTLLLHLRTHKMECSFGLANYTATMGLYWYYSTDAGMGNPVDRNIF